MICLLLASVALSLCSCGGGGQEANGDAFPAQLRGELEAIVDGAMAEFGIPGVIVGVWVPGRGSWVEARGTADISTGREIQPADRFRIGGVTMAFTATVALQLVDEGRLKLDDPLAVYFPGVAPVAEITVRQLLDHTSGLFDYSEDEGFRQIEQLEPYRKWSPEELVGIAFTHAPYSPPGQAFHLSNTDYVILGLLVEKATGSTLVEEIDRRVTGRMGLINTYFPRNSSLPGQYSHGYIEGAQGPVDYTNAFDPSWAWAAGAMTSNLDDLKAFARALGEGELVSRSMQRERLKTVPAQAGGDAFSYGLGLVSRDGFLGHDGVYPGYSCAAYYHPADEATIVVFANLSEGDGTEVATGMFKDIVGALYP